MRQIGQTPGFSWLGHWTDLFVNVYYANAVNTWLMVNLDNCGLQYSHNSFGGEEELLNVFNYLRSP